MQEKKSGKLVATISRLYDGLDRLTCKANVASITTTNVPTSFSLTTLGNVSYTYDPAGHVITRGGTLFQSIQADAITAAGATITPSLDGHGNLVGASAIADLRV